MSYVRTARAASARCFWFPIPGIEASKSTGSFSSHRDFVGSLTLRNFSPLPCHFSKMQHTEDGETPPHCWSVLRWSDQWGHSKSGADRNQYEFICKHLLNNETSMIYQKYWRSYNHVPNCKIYHQHPPAFDFLLANSACKYQALRTESSPMSTKLPASKLGWNMLKTNKH